MKAVFKVLILSALALTTMSVRADEVDTTCPKTKDSLTRSNSEKSKLASSQSEKPEPVVETTIKSK